MSITDPIAAYAAQTQAAANAAAGSTAKKSASDLGIDDFLTLMSSQLKNQDPLKPLDSTAFVAQLAQFGSVSGIQKMQTSLQTLSDSLRSSQALSGASLVGHDVLAPASTLTLGAIGTIDGALDVPSGTSALQVTVTDSAGQQVRTFDVSPQSGLTSFSWDGNADNGTRAATGTYTIKAIANVGGTNESLDPLLTGRVSSVTIDSQGTGLTLNTATLGAIALSDVRQVM